MRRARVEAALPRRPLRARHVGAALLWQALVIVGVAGCAATPPELKDSERLWAEGRLQESLGRLEEGLHRAPEDPALRAAWMRRRELLLARTLAAAEQARAEGRSEDARALYETALRILPSSERAREGLAALAAAGRHRERVAQARQLLQAGDSDRAEALLVAVLSENRGQPEARALLQQLRERQFELQLQPAALKSSIGKPITLELRDTPLRAVFDVIARTAGLNFVFDKDVRTDSRITIFLRNTAVEDVVRLVLVTNQLEGKVLNENSLLIYPGTAAKRRDYQDLVVRTFFLANVDIKQAQNLVRTVAKVREVFIDEKLNVLTIRDTRESVLLAERLLAAIDKAEPEVMLEVEVLEIARQRLRDIGLQFPNQISLEAELPLPANVPPGRVPLRNPELIATVANPALRLNLLSTDADAQLLANPRIRARNREKARVLIGEKLPVFTTTAVPNAGISSSVSYIDVGLKLEVEASVYLDNEVGIKVSLEVSNNLGEVRGPDNAVAFRLGTRSAQTTLRLRDGETQVLAGLISRTERETLAKLPGLGDLPGVGRAFSGNRLESDRSEIVLLITPRIVRNIPAPDAAGTLLNAGTEGAAGAAPLQIGPTASRSLAISAAGQGAAGARDAPDRGAPAAADEPARAGSPSAQDLPGRGGAGDARPEPGAERGATGPPQVRLQAPAQASLGREFVVDLRVEAVAGAVEAEVVLGYNAGLLQAPGAGSGRAVVTLARGADGFSGTLVMRALAAGAGQTEIRVVEARLRMADGSVVGLEAGAAAAIRIGL